MTDYKEYIRTTENFPDPGINFRDIAPLIAHGEVFAQAIHDMAAPLRGKVDRVVGLDARGFIFGAGLALELGVGLTMIRKSGKLPGEVLRGTYKAEYGEEKTLELQVGALTAENNVVMADDVSATGRTAEAGLGLIAQTGAHVVESVSLIDLPYLGGSELIRRLGVPTRSLISYDD